LTLLAPRRCCPILGGSFLGGGLFVPFLCIAAFVAIVSVVSTTTTHFSASAFGTIVSFGDRPRLARAVFRRHGRISYGHRASRRCLGAVLFAVVVVIVLIVLVVKKETQFLSEGFRGRR